MSLVQNPYEYMDYETLVREYIKLFILVMETVGQRDKNSKYQEVSKCIESNEPMIQKMIDDEPDVSVIVCNLIVQLLVDIHDSDSISGPENRDRLNELVEDMYQRHLREATNRFFRKHGLEPIDSINENLTVVMNTIII